MTSSATASSSVRTTTRSCTRWPGSTTAIRAGALPARRSRAPRCSPDTARRPGSGWVIATSRRTSSGRGPPGALPMADEPVRTKVRTDEGWLDFQTYFVGRHQAPEVRELRYDGLDAAQATPEVLNALAGADAIIVAPSNPFLSVAPLLGVPGVPPAPAGG